MKLFDLVTSKIEVFRLEQRYCSRRRPHTNRRTTATVTYIDGEYIYNNDACSTSQQNSKQQQYAGGSSASEKTLTSISTTKAGRKERRKRGNSLIEEVERELERADREGEMDVEDMLGVAVGERGERLSSTEWSGVGELKWEGGRGGF